MASAIEERNLLASVQTKDALGCKVEDLQILVQDIVVKGVGSGFKSLHDAAILTLMWRTFGRVIDTCFARKSQLSIVASGELFLHVGASRRRGPRCLYLQGGEALGAVHAPCSRCAVYMIAQAF